MSKGPLVLPSSAHQVTVTPRGPHTAAPSRNTRNQAGDCINGPRPVRYVRSADSTPPEQSSKRPSLDESRHQQILGFV